MPKLRKLEQDIYDLLKQKEPSMLLWREIVSALYSSYKPKYPKSGKKGFGSAVSVKLGKLEGKLIKHESDYWGTYNSSPPIEPTTLWHRLTQEFEQVGGHLVDLTIKKASDAGRDPVTGHYQFSHLTEETIKGIIVLRSAVELVSVAQSFKIYLRNHYEGVEYAGVVLTKDPIGWMDRVPWKNELYYVRHFEDRDDG